MICPCGSGTPYIECCALFIQGNKLAPTAEALMRSRYTAYTLQKIDYIEKTMKGEALSGFDKSRSEAWAKKVRWNHLEVVQAEERDNYGFVEFIAYFSIDHQPQVLHEYSQFVFEAGQWYYVNGRHLSTQAAPQKIGRNAPCPCGSGGKFKKCCAKRI